MAAELVFGEMRQSPGRQWTFTVTRSQQIQTMQPTPLNLVNFLENATHEVDQHLDLEVDDTGQEELARQNKKVRSKL